MAHDFSPRNDAILKTAIGCILSLLAGCSGSGATGVGGDQGAPLALVYRGPASCDGCSEAVGQLLATSEYAFDVTYVGPQEPEKLTSDALSKAALYAQPGGSITVDAAFATLAPGDADHIREFVQGGGRYLGLCMGGYFAGFSPGFQLLPGQSDAYISSPGASVTDDKDTVIDVVWRGKARTVYFQDGPFFTVDAGSQGVTIVATYGSNGAIAAMTAPFGQGKVGVVGPHPEATLDWYELNNLTDPDGVDADLGHDLVSAVMQ